MTRETSHIQIAWKNNVDKQQQQKKSKYEDTPLGVRNTPGFRPLQWLYL